MKKLNIITIIALISLFLVNSLANNNEYVIVKSENSDIMTELLSHKTQNHIKDFENINGIFIIKESKKIKKEKIKKSVDEFLKILSGSESGGHYNIANRQRFVGKYQFGRAALKSVGYKTSHINKIRNSIYKISRKRYRFDTTYFTPKQQEIAMMKYMSLYEKRSLKKILKKYDGKYFNGIYMTKAGIYAAAHLGGAGSVKKYFKSGGRINRTDANGTSLKTYMKMFSKFKYDDDLTFTEL